MPQDLIRAKLMTANPMLTFTRYETEGHADRKAGAVRHPKDHGYFSGGYNDH